MNYAPFINQESSMLVRDVARLNERFRNDLFEIKECEFGFGIFAKRRLRIGEIVFAFGGTIINFLDTKRKGPWECMPIQIGENKYIDTAEPGVYVNHSCEPNAGIFEDRNLVAISEISEGEEIRFDYSTTMLERSFTMECLCNAPNCRKIIGDFDEMPQTLQDRYLKQGIVMSFIVRAYSCSKLSESGLAVH